MKKFFLTICGYAAALMFVACGGDSGSNSVDQESDKSSSSVESDSTEVSSSSEAEYKDPTWPEGARAATLDDLKKYYKIKVKNETFYLSTGIKEGMFSLWAIDKKDDNTNLALLLVMTDFKNGIVKMDSNTTMDPFVFNENYATNKILKEIRKSGKATELSFIVEGETLKYRVDKGDFAEPEVEQVTSEKALVNSAADLDQKRLVCNVAGNDTAQVYSFFKGRYVLERVVGKNTVSWNAGFVDSYRGYTFFWSKFATGADWGLMSRKVTAGLDSIRDYASCKKSDFKYTAVDKASLQGVWAAYDEKEHLDWELSLPATDNYSLVAAGGASENKGGPWDVYGDVLFLKVAKMLNTNERCSNAQDCRFAIKGPVSEISEEGFTYNHSEKGSPAMPKKWGLPQYDE